MKEKFTKNKKTLTFQICRLLTKNLPDKKTQTLSNSQEKAQATSS